MKTRGILYFNHGERCLVRLLVSLHSLRKYYTGPVAIAAEGTPPAWFVSIAKSYNVEFVEAPASDEYGLVKKSRVWRVSPFDITLFLDADTVVRAPVDELLDLTEKHGTVQTRFNDWHTDRGRMRQRIEQWRPVDAKLVDAAIKFGMAINTGVQGWTRGEPILEEYEKLTARGLRKGISRKTLDEIAMQLLIPHYRHHIAPQEWNCGCVHNDGTKAKIVHYHGHKHCRDGPNGDIWKAEFRDLVRAFPEHEKQLIEDPKDQSIERWLATESGYRDDVTIVTAVNPAYADRLKENLAKWMQMPGLKQQNIIVFVNGFRNAAERSFLNKYRNVKVIRWDYPHDGATVREKMLAAFVLGVSEHVRTKYWMKLDGDAVPVSDKWEWPDYQTHTITSHRWGFTKMKGDEGATEHWFNRLDRLFSPSKPMFPKLDPVKDFRYSHARFNSFCHIEKTEFTRKVAKAIREKCGGRLPVPSQDTTVWYCATLWKEPIQTINMKQFFHQ